LCTARAMSQEKVEIVRGVIEAWNRRDFGTLMSFGADDVELRLIGGFADMIGDTFDGPAEVLRFWREMIIELDASRVLVVTHFQARGRGSGIEVDASGAQLWNVRGGEVHSVKLFQSKAEAVEAAGLSE